MHRLRILFLRFYPPPDSFLSILLFRLGPLGAVATYVTLKFAWVAVDFALSVIGVALSIMLPVARYGYEGYKHAREWLPHVELTPRKIDW
jgi:hypothetical protein